MRAAVLLVATIVSVFNASQGREYWSWSHETHNKDIHSVLTDSFDYTETHGQFGLGSDDSLSLAHDPDGSGNYVMRVFYKKGTYSSHDSNGDKCGSGEKCHRGAQFYATPSALSGHTHTTLTLEYEVYFEDSFSWNKGGKLPGLWGGSRDCSGGRIGNACFSTRLMWRRLGDGEVYCYHTRNQATSWSDWCHKYESSSQPVYTRVNCLTSYGTEIGTGSFRFHHHKWHKIRQEVHLNAHAGQPGYIKLWVDNHAEIHISDIVLRDTTSFDIDGIFFSTFYGGSDHTWACPRDTHTYFRNFRISDETNTPSQRLHWSWSHETYNKDIRSVLRDSFDYSDTQGQHGFGADDSLSLARDPDGSGNYVMRVFYKKGTFSGHHSNGDKCERGDICHWGAQFYATPSELSGTHTTLTLEYEVYFEDSFSWHWGGKLPGLWGGSRDCSGGNSAHTCFSTRLMWRRLGDGEVYAYQTHNQATSWSDWCHKYESSSQPLYKRVICPKSGYGTEIGKGSFRFHHHKWHKIRQEVHLASAHHPGYIKLWVDNHAEVHFTDIVLRETTSFDIDGLFFSTFYGGHNASWACPEDTHTYFRNFRITDQTHTPSQSQLVG